MQIKHQPVDLQILVFFPSLHLKIESTSMNQMNENPYYSRRLVLQGGLAGAVLLGLAACSKGSQGSTTALGSPKKGGRLRIGVPGAGTTETLDPGKTTAESDIARSNQVFEPLTRLGATGEVTYVLAEEFTPNATGDLWTVKLRKGISWHDGKPFTADDVIYTITNTLSEHKYSEGIFQQINAPALKKIDETTLQIPLKSPNFFLPQAFTDTNALIVCDREGNYSKPIGTGPFKFVSWTQGQNALYARNENYWNGVPYLDELEIISIDDPNARANALMSSTVDAVTQVPSTSATAMAKMSNLKLEDSKNGEWIALRMFTSSSPFTDVRVRQAIRLLADRPQMLSNAIGGHGRLGNDLFGIDDPDFAKDLPQRTYDPEQARSLLKQAGQENLTLTLPTTTAYSGGAYDMCTLFAASAAKAGVTVNIKNQTSADFYSVPYAKKPLGPTNWNTRPISTQFDVSLVAGSYNETDWNNPTWASAYKAAKATSNADERRKHLIDAQTVLYNDGGYMIPYFVNHVTASSAKVGGLEFGVNQQYGGWNFTKAWIS